ncbi:glycoside hydrolase superfamily [Delphinella strobiligena]|nr:glycoside hydrolase superfamily [Delphinella strobiligena]
MNSTFFDGTNATDQWSFDETEGAEAKLQQHWSTYFTESDVEQMASWGINAVRIPIGYWAYNNTGTPYITGADAYLEKAIGWCRNHGISVLVDCHGSPGSQNGFDNSGHSGQVSWQSEDNLNLSISVLETIATKYGASEYADVVFGIEIVNEPISWDQNNFDTTKQWAQDAYYAIKAVATNSELAVIMHDGFMGPSEWEGISDAINGNSSLAESKFWIDTHLYQNQEASDSLLTQEQHVQKACNWSSTELLPSSSNLPVIVGEFSAATNICANPDGSTVAGSVCYIDGCQCSANVNIEDWNEPLIKATRKFLEAELDTFEAHARGWFMWSYTGPGAWGYANAVEYGIIGKDVTARDFPGQCSSSY